MDSIIPVKRKFTGKTSGFKDNRERHFYQRMLKAYLKGKEVFHFGFTEVQDPETKFLHRVPAKHDVEFTSSAPKLTESFFERGYTPQGKPYGSSQTKKEIRDAVKARLEGRAALRLAEAP